ncbi:AAA family ATPase [Nesterenkonia halobia]|uniref:AAA family ATPase n=1 Tax=Nesterenkonia halobia TaxID=37922 RepID=UPI0031DC8A72
MNIQAALREFGRLLGVLDKAPATETAIALKPALGRIHVNIFRFFQIWEDLPEDDRNELIEFAAEERSKDPNIFVPVTPRRSGGDGLLESDLTDRIAESYESLRGLHEGLTKLAGRVQYLGPLRDEPRVVWNLWNQVAPGLPVGTRGEYSAAVLSQARGKQVEYIGTDQEQRESPLIEAVNDWAKYIQIGSNFDAQSHGKLGVGLKLEISGGVRDLTSVGVGVSQALPLLVGLLAAPRGCIFIIEQPELHLHPDVQARLADFVISARPDICAIVETHSEAFVTRLRRRVAEGSVAPNKIDILFVEPGPDGSQSRKLEVSRYGDLSDWPEGFISSSKEDAIAIMRANVEKVGSNG